jgi:superfamily II DNA helicase RecQ
LDEVLIPDTVRVMASTATATISTRKCIIKRLSLQALIIVYVPPVKDNIIYIVLR